ncbi:PH domain-containing protein [Paucibacter sp. APW11]|uniref:PH domain-containing protein n=1 Tax=Roseateles aquae TaxID=3077235 RepID=A0ABU3PCS7_9BURK|nr:PH domain-containing protein [Paucibacter sp. APW11]MDT9000132.1 PH domain-containing protein [Paucibacter sp. APW11]
MAESEAQGRILPKLLALRWLWLLRGLLISVVVAAALFYLPWALLGEGELAPAHAQLLMWAALLPPLPLLYHGARRFALFEACLFVGEGLRLRHGVWWRQEVWIPIARLQHLDVHQGPLERAWGMASLVLHTAGQHDHKAVVHGLPVAEAHALRAALMPSVRGQHE